MPYKFRLKEFEVAGDATPTYYETYDPKFYEVIAQWLRIE